MMACKVLIVNGIEYLITKDELAQEMGCDIDEVNDIWEDMTDAS